MKKERNKAVPAAYLVLRKGDEVLLTRRANTGYSDGQYLLCAGHVDAGEVPTQSLVREVMEELGIIIDPSDVCFVHSLYRTKQDETGDRADWFFEVTKWSGEITNKEPHKCDDVRWFPFDKLPENMPGYLKKVLGLISKKIVYSEFTSETI